MAVALQGLAGLLLILLLAWALSEGRRHLTPRQIILACVGTIAAQFAIALVLLRMPWARALFDTIGEGVFALQRATDAGTQLVFGYLAGAPAPFHVTAPQNGYVLAVRGLPLLLVLSALVHLLYHWGILQRVVAAVAFLLRKTVGTGGPLGTVSAASIFLGIVEAPLMIRPYLKEMERGALFAAMTVTMATIAGTVMALYATILQPLVPGAAGHLLAGSIMNVPAALLIARLMVPQGFASGPPSADLVLEGRPESSMDAIVQGTMEGLKLLVTVIAMLIVMVALVALLNAILALFAAPLGVSVTLQRLLGFVCAPLAWLIGIPWSEAVTAGSLLGQKLVLNEFIAYLDLARMTDADLAPRSRVILAYALCSFANLGSLGILIGAMTAMVPERRTEIVALAPRAVLAGFLATLMSAAVIGLLV